jgi:hypothetical protein
MDHTDITPEHRTASPAGAPARRAAGASFRKVSVVAVVACAVTGSALGLGAVGALASAGDSTPPSATSEQAAAASAELPPKIAYSEADLAAFAASPYADDALALAVVWGTPDVATAKGKAGAAITAGTPLPFGPDDAPAASYTDDQRLAAFVLAESNWSQALGLAVVWGEPTVYTAKSTVGGMLLAHEPLPAAPTSWTEDQQVAAFTAGGYTDANAAELAAAWQISVPAAQARGGAALLAGDDLPVAP